MRLSYRPKVKPHRGEAYSVVEEKLDGHRVSIIRDHYGTFAYGRKEDIDLWKYLDLPQQIPMNSMLDGELLAPGGHSTDVPTAIKDGSAIFRPFALPFFHGEDLRREPIWRARDILESFGFVLPRIWRREEVANPLQLAKDNEYEGVVLKAGHYHDWYKIKPVRTIDVIVTDWDMGTGKYIGLLGSVRIGVYDSSGQLVDLGKVGSGFSDRHRIKFHASNREQVVGRVAEVMFDSVAAKGKLRFPRFLRWRDDKPAKDCTQDQI